LFGESVELVVVSHGALLTPDRIDDLRGVDRIDISIDAASSESYGKIRQGLDYESVVANTEALLAHGGVEVSVKFLLQRDNQGEEREFARFWRSRGAAVSIDRLSNRAGTLDAFERLWMSRPGAFRRVSHFVLDRLVPHCPLPFATAYFLADGRMITCSHDWEPRDIIGDISVQSIEEIWNGEAINHYRHLLRSGRTSESLICRDCSLAGSFWAW
jgi:radical SAM protein with 4Fe4S-binding SPASM domain